MFYPVLPTGSITHNALHHVLLNLNYSKLTIFKMTTVLFLVHLFPCPHLSKGPSNNRNSGPNQSRYTTAASHQWRISGRRPLFVAVQVWNSAVSVFAILSTDSIIPPLSTPLQSSSSLLCYLTFHQCSRNEQRIDRRQGKRVKHAAMVYHTSSEWKRNSCAITLTADPLVDSFRETGHFFHT